MKLQLESMTALIVGGASGIGEAIAAGFVEEGASVVIVDRDAQLTDAVDRLRQGRNPTGKTTITGERLDVTDEPSVRKTLTKLWDERPIDHVIYAVGTGSGQFGFPFWNVEPARWASVLAVNLIGAVNVASVLAPKMAERNCGTWLFLSSIAGQMGSQTDPPYSAAKAGLINFAQVAARDLAPLGVRVNTICPGMIKTPLNRSVWQAWADRQTPDSYQDYETWTAEKIRRIVPLGRWQTPEDVANLALFLASDRAANITGQTLNVDGGIVMHS